MDKITLANAFVDWMVRRFDTVARGADTTQARYVNARADEEILCGFLTSSRTNNGNFGSTEAELPDEDPYSMTSLGFEFNVEECSILGEDELEFSVTHSIYVRVLPTISEQRKNAGWRVTSSEGEGEKSASVVETWQRFEVPTQVARVKLRQLIKSRRIVLDMGEELARWWQHHILTVPDLYPKHARLTITPYDVASEAAFDNWKDNLSRTEAVSTCNFHPQVDMRAREVPGKRGLYRITARLVNRSNPIPLSQPNLREYYDPNLYDTSLSITVPIRVHRPIVFRELEQSYLYQRTVAAVGLNCDVRSKIADDSMSLSSVTVPRVDQKRLVSREVPGGEPLFEALSAEPIPVLQGLLKAMKEYYSVDWQRRLDDLRASVGSASQEYTDAYVDSSRFLKDEVDEFESGIGLLADPRFSDNILRCFKLMNKIMGHVVTRSDRWRTFQIVFIVKMLRELASVYYPELHRESDGKVDILWFAAGGGKSEAFFGILVWQMLMDRLHNKKFGVTAFVRFPLRLLTFNQLQRLSRVLAEADKVRVNANLGGTPYSLGYLVGSDTTPNAIDNELHDRLKRQGVPDSFRRLVQCPYCGGEVKLEYDASNRLIRHVCTRCSTVIPIFIVDSDVYRFLPTVVVSTVDKLANLGQNRRFSNLFGRIDRYCPIHGAAFGRNNGLCGASGMSRDSESHPESCGNASVSYGPFVSLAPALCIIDELHLLREELGAFDGHYETIAMEVQRSLGFSPWKIVAATATIEQFERHAEHLYLKQARRFPGPGPFARESFYYTEDTNRFGRVFLGVVGVAKKHTPSVTRVLTILYRELENARKLTDEDSAKMCLELGVPPVSSDELREMIFHYEIVLAYVLTRKGSDQVSEAIENRVKHDMAQISEDELRIQTFNSGVSVSEMLGAIQEIEKATLDIPASRRIRGIVATSIVSHGVDIERFGIIVFAGLPRMVAEYIQASARIGRTFPGISVFVATPQAERDRSVFDRFGKFHEYLDRLVEPSAINRWSEAALEKTIPGAVTAYLMHVAAHRLGREIYTVEQVLELFGCHGCECLTEQAVVDWVQTALGADYAPGTEEYSEAVARVTRNVYSQVINASRVGTVSSITNLKSHLGAMRNLRDVDEPGYIVIDDEIEQAIFRAVARGL